ncbi:MAG: Gldg family protein, partial [Victivallales bacterium]|nr:Gldg family protein [Victivallales bacterium]
MRDFRIIFRRELWSHFTAPPVYALLIIYLLLSGVMTFTLGAFIDSNSADLNGFFLWQPWLLLFFASALGMGQWAEEYRTGTAELLLTLPITPFTAALGKFCAVWSVLTFGLLLTLPLAASCFILGNPDPGPMACGYLACWLAAGFFAALSQAASVISHSQFVGFILSFTLGIAMLLTGFLPCNLLLWKWGFSPTFIDAASAVSLTSHFDEMCKGSLGISAPFIFIGGIVVLLSFAVWRLNCRHLRKRRGVPALVCALLPVLLFPAVRQLPWRLDCTAEKIHTLDEGTLQIIRELPENIRIRYYFSWSYPELDRGTRDHAVDVSRMLQEMQRKSGGRIILERIDPLTPEEQERAEGDGMTPRAGSLGDLWFFGISVTRAEDGKLCGVLPLLRPEEAHTLEY